MKLKWAGSRVGYIMQLNKQKKNKLSGNSLAKFIIFTMTRIFWTQHNKRETMARNQRPSNTSINRANLIINLAIFLDWKDQVASRTRRCCKPE